MTETETRPTHRHEGIAAPICDGVLAVFPAGALLIVHAIDRYAKVDGMRLSKEARDLRAMALRTAQHAGRGHADVPSDVGGSEWPQDPIGTKEAAQLIGCSERHVRRLAADGTLGPSPIRKGRLILHRAEVLAFAEAARHSNGATT